MAKNKLVRADETIAKPKARAPKEPVKKGSPALVSSAKTKVAKALKGQVEIYAGTAQGRTGAQSIEPDHSPRGKLASLVAPPTILMGKQTYKPKAGSKGVIGLAQAVNGSDSQRAVEQFLFTQSELLDGKHWQSYVDLFADDGVYWMPALPEQTEWEGSPSIFAEDKLMMQVRLGRVTHPNAWSQAPLWATNHVIGNVQIESETAKEVLVRSRFHMMELRRDSVRHFGGTYRHTLVKLKTGYKIKLQRVDLFNGQAPFDYVLQVWV
jgi:3-phenylpropionate/cinnamic acid dioxygenase small subunit